jgi:hypothetical protein
VLAYLKKSWEDRAPQRVVVSLVQGVAVTLLLLPGKRALAGNEVVASAFDELGGLFGGQVGFEGVAVALTGLAVSLFEAFRRGGASAA